VPAKSDSVSIIVGRHGLPPFSETAAAGELATMNLAVLGQLMALDEGFNAHPVLLSEARYDYQREVYVLKMRGDLRFHHGRLATAEDLEFSLVRGFFSTHHSFYRTYIGNIEGIDGVVGKKYQSGMVTGVRVTGPLTVEVKLRAPNPAFLPSLVNPYFSLVPREALEDNYMAWKRYPIGVGPYRVEEPGFHDGMLTLVKVDPAKAGPLRVTVYTKDVLPAYDVSILKDDDVKNSEAFYPELSGAIATLFLSRLNPLGSNPHFRKALVHLIDRNAFVAGIPGTSPARQMLPERFWGRDEIADKYDLAAARREIALIPEDLRKKPWHFALFMGANKTPTGEHLKTELTRQFKAVGLDITPIDTTEKFTSKESALANPIIIASRITDYVDPLIMLQSFRSNGPDPYLTAEHDPEFERLFAAAAMSKNREDRVSTVRQLSRYLVDQVFCVPVIERRYPVFYDKMRVSLGHQPLPIALTIASLGLR
jgi:ABC-type transport system substrate-binding protein